MWGYWGSVPTDIPTTHPLILGFNEPDHENQVRIRIKNKRGKIYESRWKKHCNKNYVNGVNGKFAVLNMTIFLTQANMSFEYDNFSYSGKYEPRKSLGRLAFVAGGIS